MTTMRVLLIALIVSLGVAGTAAATIVGVSGDAQLIPAPPSVQLGELTSDETMFVFDEQHCVPLPSDVAVDIAAAGKYNDPEDLTGGTIVAGTMVSTQFVHVDSRHGKPGRPKYYTGGLTFDSDILGVAILTETLNASDYLGAPGTSYPDHARKINLRVNDYVIWNKDNRSLDIHTGNHVHMDQVRVFTACSS
jgi:hypothetical protein